MKCRSLFISDAHLYASMADPGPLLDLLRCADVEYLYLVGDIVDLWTDQIARADEDTETAIENIIGRLLLLAQEGRKVIYVPGNHDGLLRQFDGLTLAGIAFRRDAVHTTIDGKRLWITHGDQFDALVKHRTLAALAAICYDLAHQIGRLRPLRRWSLAKHLGRLGDKAILPLDRFRRNCADGAVRKQCTTVICGHTHVAEHRRVDGIRYLNCGDWVQSRTCVIETEDGSLYLERESRVGIRDRAGVEMREK